MLSIKPQLKGPLTKVFSDPSISTLNPLSLPTYSYRFDFCTFCSLEGEYHKGRHCLSYSSFNP